MPFALLFLDVLHKKNEPLISEVAGLLTTIVLMIMSGGFYYWGLKRFKQGLKRSISASALSRKMLEYYECNVDKFAWYTIAAFTSILGLLLTRSYLFIVSYIFVLASLSIFRPTLRSLVGTLGLNEEEKEILMENKDIVVS